MKNKYLPLLAERKKLVATQVGECQTLIYRNLLENLTFKEKNDQDKMTEVEVNNAILQRKLDLLFKEWEKLNNEGANEDRSDSPIPGAVVQPDPGRTT